MNEDNPINESLSMLVSATLEFELLASGYWFLYSCDNLSELSGAKYFVNTGGGLYKGLFLVDFLTFLLNGASSFKLKLGMSGKPWILSGMWWTPGSEITLF